MADYLYQKAEILAETLYNICIHNKKNIHLAEVSKNLVKIPPIFMDEENGKTNIISVIKTISDYNNQNLTLKELINKYNKYGGTPKLASNDLRKLHNWIQQISFVTRAASIINELEENFNLSEEQIANNVYQNLYENLPECSFIYKTSNEYKPLKYASKKVIIKWINEEVAQIKNNEVFGAIPSNLEIEFYGIRKHDDDLYSDIKEKIHQMIKNAKNMDTEGDFQSADNYYIYMKTLYENLK